MQMSMFAPAEPVISKAKSKAKVYDFNRVVRDKSYKTRQQDMVFDAVPEAKITVFKSGSSAKADILGYMAAQSPIGITAIDASKPVRRLVGQYVSEGGHVFVDSGAYRNFRAREKDPTVAVINFDDVFESYYDILDNCTSTTSLILVAPDEVGDQEKSFELLVEYCREIKLLARRGVKFMVPMQKGDMSLQDHYLRCGKLLGMDFIVGLPSNAEAVSKAEVLEFVATASPSEVHFLGCAESALVHEAQHSSPATTFSCDATLLRKHIGEGRLLTEMHRQRLGELACHALHGENTKGFDHLAQYDESELHLFDIIPQLSKDRLQELSDFSGLSIAELSSATDAEQIDTLMFEGGSYQGASLFVSNWVTKRISPSVRTACVYELAMSDIV